MDPFDNMIGVKMVESSAERKIPFSSLVHNIIFEGVVNDTRPIIK